MRNYFYKGLKKIKDVFLCVDSLFSIAKKYVYYCSLKRVDKEWSSSPAPVFFKHEYDLYRWPFDMRNGAEWVERGVHARSKFFKGCVVLDLCCGDGSYPYLFFRDIAKRIDAVDANCEAIKYAKKHYAAERIQFMHCNILDTDMLDFKEYDFIIWNAGIGYFTTGEQKYLLAKIAKSGKSSLMLIGTTPLVDRKTDSNHKDEFYSIEQLQTLLDHYFLRVSIDKSFYNHRTNLLFSCSHPRQSNNNS